MHQGAWRIGAERVLFAITVAWGAAIPWIAAHPPMIDLPQHAGQLALLQQRFSGNGAWSELFQINPWTPYFLAFGIALPIGLVLPVAATLKLLLSCAFLAFVTACAALRRHFNPDPRLDWISPACFFGFAYAWGFLTFLTALPLGLCFILLADRHAVRGGTVRGLGLTALGLLLLVSHGLVFLFAWFVGAALLVARTKDWRGLPARAVPLVVIGGVCVAYTIARAHAEAAFGLPKTVPSIMWQVGFRHEVLSYAFGIRPTLSLAAATALMLAAPWLAGMRVTAARRAAAAPFAVAVAVLAFAPSFASETSFVYQRFAIVLLPAYALLFESAGAGLRRTAALALMVLTCWALLLNQSIQAWRFDAESRDFDRVVERIESGARALALIFDASSDATGIPGIYVHHASWYQAEQGGLVDFNFAWAPPQVLRYRDSARPPVGLDLARHPSRFDWQHHAAGNYRYFFLRGADVVPERVFRGAPCAPRLVATAGKWQVYENRSCTADGSDR